jgi:hypothetical protein
MSKLSKLSANDFYRWFRKEVRPLVSSPAVEKPVKEFLENLLGKELYFRITNLEERLKNETGDRKMQLLQGELKALLRTVKMEALMPFVKIFAERAVLFLYREAFMEKVKELGAHEYLETMFKMDIDEDGDIGVANDPPKIKVSSKFDQPADK